jgi:hypothetical protein
MVNPLLLELEAVTPQGAMKYKPGSHKIFKYLKVYIFYNY